MKKNFGWKWILILWGVGFLTGFIGPLIFAPEANQGPLLGIFITGPIGFFAGIALWILSSLFSWSHSLEVRVLGVCCFLFLAALFAILAAPKPEWPGRSYQLEVNACESSSSGEVILRTTILHEKQYKIEKPIFKKPFIRAGEITTASPQHLSFYIAGNCSDFPIGFKGTYYVDNHPAHPRDRAVLLPIPERFKNY